MVESKQLNARQLLLKTNAIQNVLECFDIRKLLDLRYANKRIGQELVPRCFKVLKHRCTDEDDEEEDEDTFYLVIRNAKKVIIENI